MILPPASIDIYAEPAVLAATPEIVGLLGEHNLVFDAAGVLTMTENVSEVIVPADGPIHVWFYEGEFGASRLLHGDLQEALRNHNIPYHVRFEEYNDEDAEERWEPCPYCGQSDIFVDEYCDGEECPECGEIATFDPEENEEYFYENYFWHPGLATEKYLREHGDESIRIAREYPFSPPIVSPA